MSVGRRHPATQALASLTLAGAATGFPWGGQHRASDLRTTFILAHSDLPKGHFGELTDSATEVAAQAVQNANRRVVAPQVQHPRQCGSVDACLFGNFLPFNASAFFECSIGQ